VLARQVASESDPVRFMKLVQELLDETDRVEAKAASSRSHEDRKPD
jgi:hypothetical protein